MNEISIIVKIGGKILEKKEDLNATLKQFQLLLKENFIQNIVIIPGGGSRANFIRQLDNEFELGDDLSHWMAIYAMDLNGIWMHEQFPFTKLLNDINELESLLNPRDKFISILLPYNHFKQEDPLPHTWDVTSDSICLYFAKKLGLNEVFLIKDIDGVMIKENNEMKLIKNLSTTKFTKLLENNKFQINKSDPVNLKRSVPIDSYSLTLITRYKILCIILNGNGSKLRIQNYFKEKKEEDKYYTKIF